MKNCVQHMILNGPIKLNILKPGVEEHPLIIWHFQIMEKLPLYN